MVYDFTGLPECATVRENTVTWEHDDFTHNKSLNSSIKWNKISREETVLKRKKDHQKLAHVITTIHSSASHKIGYRSL